MRLVADHTEDAFTAAFGCARGSNETSQQRRARRGRPDTSGTILLVAAFAPEEDGDDAVLVTVTDLAAYAAKYLDGDTIALADTCEYLLTRPDVPGAGAWPALPASVLFRGVDYELGDRQALRLALGDLYEG